RRAYGTYLIRSQKSAPFFGAERLADSPKFRQNRAGPEVDHGFGLEDIESVVGGFVSELLQSQSHC
ncbi:unnamed protein product, partial [Mycena citricolor]